MGSESVPENDESSPDTSANVTEDSATISGCRTKEAYTSGVDIAPSRRSTPAMMPPNEDVEKHATIFARVGCVIFFPGRATDLARIGK
jgi:hypothetical protein